MKRIICIAICIGFLLIGCYPNTSFPTISTEISTIPTSLPTETRPASEIAFFSPSFSVEPSKLVIQEENCEEPSAAVAPSTVAAPVKQSPVISTPQLKDPTIPKPQPLPYKETRPPIETSKSASETEPALIETLPIPDPSVSPATTQLLETLPPSELTSPPETIPKTEPVETAPPQCNHNWQRVDYPETGHYEEYHVCGCGFRFSDIGSYDAHVAQYTGTAEMFTVHGHWGSTSQWIVDAAGYSEWYCSTCGVHSNSQP